MLKFKNAAWLILESFIRLVVGIAVSSLLARHLGPQEFGLYAYLFSFVSLFSPVAMMGLEAVVLHRHSRYPETRDLTIGTALAIRAVFTLITIALSALLLNVIGGPEDLTARLTFLAAVTLAAMPAGTINDWFKASERMALVALPRLAVTLLVSGATLFMIIHGAGLEELVAICSAEGLALLLVAMAVYSVETRSLRCLAFDPSLCVLFLRQGFPVALAGISMMVYLRIDQVMIGHLGSEFQLGLYAVAVRLADAVLFLPAVLQSVYYSSLARAHLRDEAAFEIQVQRFFDAMTLTGFAIMVGVGLAGWLLLVPIFGSSFAGARPILMVLVLELPFFFMIYAWGAIVTVKGWFWTAPLLNILGALLNVALNLILISRFGGLGAAWATVISYAFAGYLLLFSVGYLRPFAISLSRSFNPAGALLRTYYFWREEESE